VNRSIGLGATILAVTLAACHLSKPEYATIDAWLLCDECPDSLRLAVKNIGGKAVHTLDQALIGPSPGRRANKAAQFRYSYAMLPSPAVSESAYVADLLSNYVANYQSHAAISLGDIRTSAALAALQRASDSAAARKYRPDVVKVINVVLALASAKSFGGTVNGNAGAVSARFADTVHVGRGAGLGWDGDESVIVHGSPFADSLLVARWSPDSLAFLAVAPLGDYAVSVTGLGANSARQVFPLRVVPPGYASHTAATAPLVTVDSIPQTRYLLLPSRPGDTTDFFRFEPTATHAVTASVTASGLEPATLRWLTCPALTLLTIPGPTTSVTGRVIDEQGRRVAGAEVMVPGYPTSAVTDSTGRFVLSGIAVEAARTFVARKVGFHPTRTLVQLAADSVQLGVVDSLLTAGTAVNRHASTLTMPAGSCRLLEVLVPFGGGPRTLRLRLTSP